MSEEGPNAAPGVRPEGLDDLLTALQELEAAQRQLLARLTEIQHIRQAQRAVADIEAALPRVLH